MYKVILGTIVLAVLAGCTMTPLQQCQTPIRKELSDNAALIEETRDNLDRGYTFLPSNSRVGLKFCANPTGVFSVCANTEEQLTYRRITIDRAAETARLQALEKRRGELEAAYTQCTERYGGA